MVVERVGRSGWYVKGSEGNAPTLLPSIIQAPWCGATVCRTRHRLGVECTFHCHGNDVCIPILIWAFG